MVAGVGDDARDVQSIGVVEPAADVADGHDTAPGVGEDANRMPANLAEALNRDPSILKRDSPAPEHLHGNQGDAAAGGFAAPGDAADGQGLAGHDGRIEDAGLRLDGVKEPGHDLLVGVDIRRGNVDARADNREHGGGVGTCEPRQFAGGEERRVAVDPALAAAVGEVEEGALPGHEGCQPADLV